MSETYQITPHISWVGVTDPDLRIFDIIIPTDWGTTYNAYLIKGAKTALVETVKEAFFDEYLAKLQAETDLAAIDYVVLNHTEPDHTGVLTKLLPLLPNATVVGSRSAINFAKAISNLDFPTQVVGDGDEISLGNLSLRFITAPFLHWPDSIFTYVPEEQVLFTCDAFGGHYCPPEGKLFDDQVEDFTPALRVYFQAIMGPFKNYVLQAAKKIEHLPVKVIAPSHGPILRAQPWKYVELYRAWASEGGPVAGSVAIGYLSAYGFTRLLAETIAGELTALGSTVDLFDLSTVSAEQAGESFRNAAGILIGTPTLNRDAVPPVWVALSHLSAIENRNKPASAFGAYGWSGEAVPMVLERLRSLGLKVMEPGLKVNFRPNEDDLGQAKEFARQFYQCLS